MISLETTLRRIIVGYRAIAMLWMLSLALVTLASDEAERPAVIVAAVGLAAVWTSLTLWISFRRPGLFRSWAFLGLDIFVSALILVSPNLSVSPNFVGGYPLSSVLIGVLGKGLLGATAPVLVLVSLVLIQIGIGDRIGDPTVLSSNVLVHGGPGHVGGWRTAPLGPPPHCRRIRLGTGARRANSSRRTL